MGLLRANSIRYKLMMVVLATTLTALLLTGAAMVYYDVRNYQQSWVDDLLTQADILGRTSAAALSFDDRKVATETLSVLKLRPQISAAALYTAKGALFAAYTSDEATDASFPKLPELDGYQISGKKIVVFKRIIDNKEILGTVYLQARYELVDRVKGYLSILTVVMIASLLIALLLSSWLNSVVTKPILAISDLTRKVVENRDFTLQAERTTDDEIGYLATGFNDMLAEIDRQKNVLEVAEGELHKLNAELEQRVAQRTSELQAVNKEMESFSYSVSHDLRAPLRAIAGFSKMLDEDHAGKLGDDGRRKLGIIQSEAKRMGNLIDDLLTFSRLGRKPIEQAELDMGHMVNSLLERLQAQHKGPKAEVRVGPLPSAQGDRALLEQVWANLISNALKYSSKRDQAAIEIAAISDEKEYVYFVRDNGAGFDPRYRSKLFGVFQRLHNASEFDGTGVGLALVHQIVLRHGGRVWAEGEPDKGATFYFTLPREPRDAGS